MRISDWSSDVCSSDLLALAVFLLRIAQGLDGEHGFHGAAQIADLAEMLGAVSRLALVDEVFLHVLEQAHVLRRAMEAEALVALRRRTRRLHVAVLARPPDTQHLVTREADGSGFLDRHGVHRAPALPVDIVRTPLETGRAPCGER